MPTAANPRQPVFSNPISVSRNPVGISYQAPTSTTCCCPACLGLQCLDRTRFFAGQLLSEADLNNEQSYWLAKQRLHNRYLMGWGVVCGMQVVCAECAGWVTVNPGYAIDPCGNDVIVCQAQNFNVLQAIQQCCAPAAPQTANCSPLRYNPSPTCKNSKQEWCITIQYQEQSSRLVTPLSNSASAQCSTSCGCSSNGNGSSGSKQSSSGTTTTGSCNSTANTQSTTATVPAGACEATRIVEGFQLGVVPATQVAEAIEAGNPNSLKSQVESCLAGVAILILQAPKFVDQQIEADAYQATCNYLGVVQQYFATADDITLCSIFAELSTIIVPTGKDIAVYRGIVANINRLIGVAFLNCVCLSIVPPCPSPACDNRIVLACVTVENGAITNICHFPGRNQLITLQTLGYWLGALGLDRLGLTLSEVFAALCCSAKETYTTGVFGAKDAYYSEGITTAGVTSGADMNRIAAHYVAQSLGAQMVNTFNPSARAVDLRSYVSKPSKQAMEQLREQGVKTLTMQAVDSDPAWDADAIASGAQYAPAAVSVTQPIVMYTQGDVAVGFGVVDLTTARINDLQSQITALQNQMNQAQTSPAGAQPSQKAQNPAP